MSSAPDGVTTRGVASSGNVWYSQKLIFWGTPSSVIVKSFVVRPSIGLPFLSLTTTASTTRRVVTEMVGVSLAPAGLFCPVNCAPEESAPAPAATERAPAASVKRSSIELGNRILQNLRRSVTDMLRIPLELGTAAPNCGLLSVVM